MDLISPKSAQKLIFCEKSVYYRLYFRGKEMPITVKVSRSKVVEIFTLAKLRALPEEKSVHTLGGLVAAPEKTDYHSWDAADIASELLFKLIDDEDRKAMKLLELLIDRDPVKAMEEIKSLDDISFPQLYKLAHHSRKICEFCELPKYKDYWAESFRSTYEPQHKDPSLFISNSEPSFFQMKIGRFLYQEYYKYIQHNLFNSHFEDASEIIEAAADTGDFVGLRIWCQHHRERLQKLTIPVPHTPDDMELIHRKAAKFIAHHKAPALLEVASLMTTIGSYFLITPSDAQVFSDNPDTTQDQKACDVANSLFVFAWDCFFTAFLSLQKDEEFEKLLKEKEVTANMFEQSSEIKPIVYRFFTKNQLLRTFWTN